MPITVNQNGTPVLDPGTKARFANQMIVPRVMTSETGDEDVAPIPEPGDGGVAPVPASPELPPVYTAGNGMQFRLAQDGSIEWIEPARPEGIFTWTTDELYAWAAAHPTLPPPAGVPADAIWDPARGDWYENVAPGGGEGPDFNYAGGRRYYNHGVTPMANYFGGSYIGPGTRLLTYGGRPDIYPNRAGGPVFSVPTTSIKGTLRPGDTGYRGPIPPPPSTTISLAPARPLGVPEDWIWDSSVRNWRPPNVATGAPRPPGVNVPRGSTTETAAPRYIATPPNETPPVALYNNNQGGTVSPPGTPGPVAEWNYSSPFPGRPSPQDIRDANLDYIDRRVQGAV